MVNGDAVQAVKVTPEDSDVLRLVSLKEYVLEGKNTVDISFQGEGSMLYQVVGTYYLPWHGPEVVPEGPLTIGLDYDKRELEKDDTLTCNVRVAYRKPGTAPMVIVDLGIPPGFDVMSEDLAALVKEKRIERFDLTGRQIILYLTGVEQGRPFEFSYRLKARFPIRAKTLRSTVYEYYNPDTRGVAVPVELVVP